VIELNKIRVLNLYAGIGGNRKLWENVEVTAIENNPEIAKIYQDFFPNDKVIVTDAHQYLLERFKEFDFIWSSPPCPSHSRFRFLWKSDGKNINGNKISGSSFLYPDMKLYEEIIFLKTFCNTKFCIENVISYYKPLVPCIESGNHYYWTNFYFKPLKNDARFIRSQHLEEIEKMMGFDLSKYNLPTRLRKKLLNNCVLPEYGLHVFNCAFKQQQTRLAI